MIEVCADDISFLDVSCNTPVNRRLLWRVRKVPRDELGEFHDCDVCENTTMTYYKDVTFRVKFLDRANAIFRGILEMTTDVKLRDSINASCLPLDFGEPSLDPGHNYSRISMLTRFPNIKLVFHTYLEMSTPDIAIYVPISNLSSGTLLCSKMLGGTQCTSIMLSSACASYTVRHPLSYSAQHNTATRTALQ